jgi:hypothetical protein
MKLKIEDAQKLCDPAGKIDPRAVRRSVGGRSTRRVGSKSRIVRSKAKADGKIKYGSRYLIRQKYIAVRAALEQATK